MKKHFCAAVLSLLGFVQDVSHGDVLGLLLSALADECRPRVVALATGVRGYAHLLGDRVRALVGLIVQAIRGACSVTA